MQGHSPNSLKGVLYVIIQGTVVGVVQSMIGLLGMGGKSFIGRMSN